VIFVFLTLQHSIGNVLEILNLLDKDKYSGEQIIINYEILQNKWGELNILSVGGTQIKYIDIRKAFFNGASITYFILFIFSILFSVMIGKILLPKLSKMYENSNQQMVDVATLKTQEIISNKKEEEWF